MDIADVPGLVENPPDRCYICKRALFARMEQEARARGFGVILDGTNADDVGDYRPGMRALAELGVQSPLKELGFTKARIRRLSAARGLPTAEKPALACLATRIPFGTRLDAETMRRIDDAETRLMALGFAQVRVRAHGGVARIEAAQGRESGGRGARAGRWPRRSAPADSTLRPWTWTWAQNGFPEPACGGRNNGNSRDFGQGPRGGGVT